MYTYQDLLEVSERETERIEFARKAINLHKQSDIYKIAVVADKYDRQQNATIMEYRKLLYTVTGEAVPDNYSANYKTASGFFNRFVTQQNQYLLGNGVSWNDESTAEKLGEDFNARLQEIGKMALVSGVAFGFFNYDHMDVFDVKEFVPLYDEENGALMAGIRFWQVADDKPLRATLYEEDGYTDYIWNRKSADKIDGMVLHDKRSYTEIIKQSDIDGTEIYDGENYPTFPIVPLWGNPHHQSEILGIRSEIDAYDLIKSGFANDIDDASQIYWTIQNAGGMDDVDLAKFIERMKTVKASVMDDDGARAEAHTLDVPYNAREAILDRLEKDLYKDYMALNTEAIAGGAITATQIKAAYEPLNVKTDQYEYCVLDFIQGILAIAGIDDKPTFTRSKIVNVQEEVQTVIASADFVDADYVTRKILTLFGDNDLADEMLEKMESDEYSRMTGLEEEDGTIEGEPLEEDDEGMEDDEMQSMIDELMDILNELGEDDESE